MGDVRTLIHLSDVHFGRLDEGAAGALVGYVRGLRGDVMVVSGDFTQRARKHQFEAARAYLRQFGMPQVWVPGNHDVPLFAFWERLWSPYGRYRAYMTSEMGPVYQDEEVAIAGVCSARAFVPVWRGFWKDGAVDVRQLAGLERLMGGVKVVVMHHPMIGAPGKGEHGVVVGKARALEVMARAGVDVVLGGHLHEAYSGEMRVKVEGGERSIVSVQCGTSTSDRLRRDVAGKVVANAVNRLIFEGEKMVAEVHSYVEGRWGKTCETVYTREKGGKNWGVLHGFTL